MLPPDPSTRLARNEVHIEPPPTEAVVPNEQKALPTQRNLIFALAVGASVVAILGGVVGLGVDLRLAGFLLCLVGVAIAVTSAVMAYGDARASMITPILSAVACGIVACVVAVAALSDENIDLAEVIVPPPADEQPADVVVAETRTTETAVVIPTGVPVEDAPAAQPAAMVQPPAATTTTTPAE